MLTPQEVVFLAKKITNSFYLAFCWGWGRAHCTWRLWRWCQVIVSWAGKRAWPCQGTMAPPPTAPRRRQSAWCSPTRLLYFLPRLLIRTTKTNCAAMYPARSEQNSHWRWRVRIKLRQEPNEGRTRRRHQRRRRFSIVLFCSRASFRSCGERPRWYHDWTRNHVHA